MKKHKYAGYFRVHTKVIVWIIVLTTLAKACTFYSAQVLSDVVDQISDLNFTFDRVLQTAIVLFAVETLYAITNFTSNRRAEKVKKSVTRQLHMNLARKIANASSKTVKQNNSVELSEKMREGNNFVEGIYGIYNQIFAIILGIAALTYTFMCSSIIGIMFIVFFIMVLVIQFIIIKQMVKKREEASSASDNSKKLLVEILQGFPDVKSLSLLGGLKTHFIRALDNEYELNITTANLVVRNELWTNLILSVYKMIFLLISAWLMLKGNLTKVHFISLFMYRNYVYGLINSIISIVKDKSQVVTAQKRMNEVFDYQAVSEEKYGTTNFYPITGNLSINNLTVKYGNSNALDNVSLNIPAGKFVAIVGESGCGKSTLLNVIARQESPASGTILVDNADMFDLDEWTYHNAIAHVPQFPFMFSMSIKENLLLANPNASDEDIWRALDECYAKDFVESKGGLDAVIEPTQLSGGQQQRLALARIALRGGRILLLDESTSALDSVAQDEVVKTIQRATASGHTVMLVSHRAAPLKKADLIVYMANGKVETQGTFEKLYAENKNFRRLVDLGG